MRIPSLLAALLLVTQLSVTAAHAQRPSTRTIQLEGAALMEQRREDAINNIL